jgi:hypothetical protein
MRSFESVSSSAAITPGGDELGHLPSASTLFAAVCSNCGRDVCAIVSTSCRDLLIEACRELLIEEVIDSDVDRASSDRRPHEVRLRFLLFGLSMLAYLPV